MIGKTIVFAVNKRRAEALARLFDAEFAHLKPAPDVRVADYVVSGLGGDDSFDGMRRIRRFKKEKFPQILVSVNMLGTGFGFPDVVNLVFARFTRSSILYQQMRGRGTRKAKNRPVFTLFYFVGVCAYHGDDYAEGGFVLARQAKKKYEPRRLLTLDVDDHIDPTTREWISVDENGNMVFPQASEQRATELGTRFEAWFLAQPGLNAGEKTWLRMVGNQLRANADHYTGGDAGFVIEQFTFNPFQHLGRLAQAVRVFGSEERLQAVIESLNDTLFGRPPDDGGPRNDAAAATPPPAPH